MDFLNVNKCEIVGRVRLAGRAGRSGTDYLTLLWGPAGKLWQKINFNYVTITSKGLPQKMEYNLKQRARMISGKKLAELICKTVQTFRIF